MRIIAGSAKGKRLGSLGGHTIRPTSDRVREALFSMIQSRLGPFPGKSVLDLFAGTGALSLEALSRGAEMALLIDQGREAARLIPDNIRACAMVEKATFRHQDVFTWLARPAPKKRFDLIFLDPPYGLELVPKALTAIERGDLLSPGGMICAEAQRKDAVPERVGSLHRVVERRFGTTVLHLFTIDEDQRARSA